MILIALMLVAVQANAFASDDHGYHNKFYGSGTEHAEGTGLGLFPVKKTIEANRGSIEVNFRKGDGTTFIISIPVA